MSVKLRVLLFILITCAVGASAVLLYLYKSPVSLSGIETFCGYRGSLFENIEANLTRDHKLWLNKTRKAFRDEYPFALFLNLTINETTTVGNESRWKRGFIGCNGVIVSQQWLLTSAQCVNHSLLLNESYAATSFVSSGNLTQEVKLTTVKVIKHFDFTRNETTGLIINDIALVRVESIKFIEILKQGRYLCPLCTDESEKIDEAFTPWFQSSVEEKGNITLFTSEMTVLSSKECRKFSPDLPDSSICTTQPTLKFDARKKVEEKGSPLVVQESKMNLVAISSYYINRKQDPPILVHTNVSRFNDWIKRIIY